MPNASIEAVAALYVCFAAKGDHLQFATRLSASWYQLAPRRAPDARSIHLVASRCKRFSEADMLSWPPATQRSGGAERQEGVGLGGCGLARTLYAAEGWRAWDCCMPNDVMTRPVSLLRCAPARCMLVGAVRLRDIHLELGGCARHEAQDPRNEVYYHRNRHCSLTKVSTLPMVTSVAQSGYLFEFRPHGCPCKEEFKTAVVLSKKQKAVNSTVLRLLWASFA